MLELLQTILLRSTHQSKVLETPSSSTPVGETLMVARSWVCNPFFDKPANQGSGDHKGLPYGTWVAA